MASKTLGKHLEFSEYLSLQKLIYVHFIPTLLLYDLVLSTAADITGHLHHTQQQDDDLNYSQQLVIIPKPKDSLVLHKSDPISFFIHIL